MKRFLELSSILVAARVGLVLAVAVVMNFRDGLQLIFFVGILLATAKPLARYMMAVFEGKKTLLSPVLGPLERLLYRVAGVDAAADQGWKAYAAHMAVFSAMSLMATYGVLALQHRLPLNPQGMGPLSFDLTLNTAVSFLTNTNWQSYGGEGTLSYFAQMVALTLQNFLSAAVGIAVAVALIRGIARRQSKGIGNFWADMVRANLYVLLPLSLLLSLALVSQGMIQNFLPYQEVTTLEGAKQVIAQGPVASQVAIKMIGTNGGGFFNANAAHPYENPTPLSNFLQMLAIFLIPSALVYMLGAQAGNRRHGWAVWGAMAFLFVAGVLAATHFESAGNPMFTKIGCSSSANMEGKEARFGIFNSALFATVTTDASCGAVNAMHDSFTPLGGLVPLVNMLLGELVFGGVGAGLYGMMLYIILTVFIAGLMIGRTPEYMGKKIGATEVKYVMFAVIITSLSVLGFSAAAVLDPRGVAALANPGPHGFSEILYAYTSASANNGSAFGGLSANVPFWNFTLAGAMLIGRFFVILPVLALAGALAQKKVHPASEATFPVDGALFAGLLVGVILLVGALTFFPALALGPVVEHFEMLRGNLFQ